MGVVTELSRWRECHMALCPIGSAWIGGGALARFPGIGLVTNCVHRGATQ
jgi:hypothetical protein